MDREDIGALANQWEQERKKEPNLDPACVLFPHTRTMDDQDLKSFYNEVNKRGYTGHQHETVNDVAELAETYGIITHLVVDDFIRF